MDIERGRSTMNVALWIVQGLLAALFLFAGGAKLVLPLDQMAGPVALPGWVLEIHRRGRSARRARPGPPRASAHPAGPDPAGRGGAGDHHDRSDDRHVGWRYGRGGATEPGRDAPRCVRRLRPLAAGAVSRLVPPGGTPARPGPRFESLTA